MAGGKTLLARAAPATNTNAVAPPPPTKRPVGPEDVRRALALVDARTTDMADSILTVPLSYYRDPTQARQEQQLLRRTPLALAPTAQLPNPNDFVVREVLGTSVLLTRDAQGKAHAFLNYCRHRGGKPAEGCGNARRHTCPYHAWSYDSAGRLVGLPGQEGFDGLARDDYGLVALPTEERHGFVWAVLTVGAPIDVAAHLGPLDAELAAWGLSTSTYLTEREVHADVNWKAAIEAFAENYHFPYVHAQSIVGQNTSPTRPSTTSTAGTTASASRARGSRAPRDNLDDADPLASMAFIYWIFPNLTLAMSAVGTEIIDILPADDAAHPGRCVVRHGWMATEPAANDAVQAGYVELYEAVHAAVRDEDCGVLRGCGEAAREGQHDHMVIGRNEIAVQHVVVTFTQALGSKT